jgi:hypothetical protein
VTVAERVVEGSHVEDAARGAQRVAAEVGLDARPLEVRHHVGELDGARQLPACVCECAVVARVHRDAPGALVHPEPQGVGVPRGRPGGLTDARGRRP